MPPRRRLRKIVAPPRFRGYKPYGTVNHESNPIELLYEEYEALKLADYDGLNHNEASKLMGISRATFARIYEMARQKIARALVETREIKTSYGNATFDESWFICSNCQSRFTLPEQSSAHCPLCKSKNYSTIDA